MAKAKSLSIKIDGENVMYSNISKSKDGYNSCRVVAKISDNEYMSVSYEWEGDSVPGFCMDLMGFMQANELEIGEHEELAVEYNITAAKKGENPFAKKDDKMEEEDDDKKKKGKDKKKKSKDKKKEKSDTEEE